MHWDTHTHTDTYIHTYVMEIGGGQLNIKSMLANMASDLTTCPDLDFLPPSLPCPLAIMRQMFH